MHITAMNCHGMWITKQAQGVNAVNMVSDFCSGIIPLIKPKY